MAQVVDRELGAIGIRPYLAALDREEDAAPRDLQRLSAVSHPCRAALSGSKQAQDCERRA